MASKKLIQVYAFFVFFGATLGSETFCTQHMPINGENPVGAVIGLTSTVHKYEFTHEPSMLLVTGIGASQSRTNQILKEAFTNYRSGTVIAVHVPIINRFLLAGHKIPCANQWICRLGGIIEFFVPKMLIPTLNQNIQLRETLGTLWNKLEPVKNFWEPQYFSQNGCKQITFEKNGAASLLRNLTDKNFLKRLKIPIKLAVPKPTVDLFRQKRLATKNILAVPEEDIHHISCEPSKIAAPFTTHTMVFITGIGLPAKQTNKLLTDAFETCLPKTILVVPTQILDRFLLSGNTVPHKTKWRCRGHGSLRVFVPKKLLPKGTTYTELDKILGIYVSKCTPIKNFWSVPSKQPKITPESPDFEKTIFADFSGYNLAYTLIVPDWENKNKITWALYIVGGGALDNGNYFDQCIGKIFTSTYFKLCFWETAADLNKFKKNIRSSYPLVISGLLASGIDQKFDFSKIFSPLTENTIHTRIGHKNFIALDTITRNFYSSFNNWDNPDYKRIIPHIRFKKKHHFTPYINLCPFVDPKEPNSFLIKQGKMYAAKPFANHAMIIFNCIHEYKDCMLDSLKAAMSGANDFNTVIVVPSGLVQQYIEKRGSLPNADAWLCRRRKNLEIYVPKAALTMSYGDKINSTKKIQEIDALLGIKWSSLEPIKNFNDNGVTGFLSYFYSPTHDAYAGPEKNMSKDLCELIVTLAEYADYNKSHKQIEPADWVFLFDGHGSPGQTVDMAIESALNKPVSAEQIKQLRQYKEKGLIFMPGKIGVIANFGTGLIELLIFFNEQCSTKLVFIETCYGWHKKLEQLDKQNLTYTLIMNNLVNTTSSGRGKDKAYGSFVDILQKNNSIRLEKLIRQIYPISPGDGGLPQVRLPGKQNFSPLTLKNNADVFTIAKQPETKVVEIPMKKDSFINKCILLKLEDLPFTLKFPPISPQASLRAFISLLPGSAIHTIDEIDFATNNLESIIRAFSFFELKENKVFIVNKIISNGKYQGFAKTSHVKLTVVNNSGTDEYEEPTVHILVENLDKNGPLGGYAEWKGCKEDVELTLKPCTIKEELEKQKVDMKKRIDTIKFIRDFSLQKK